MVSFAVRYEHWRALGFEGLVRDLRQTQEVFLRADVRTIERSRRDWQPTECTRAVLKSKLTRGMTLSGRWSLGK